jgi:hypothetical protein
LSLLQEQEELGERVVLEAQAELQLAVPPGCTYRTNANGTRILNGYVLTAAQVAENNRLMGVLTSAPDTVEVNASACATGGITGCTNLVGLPPLAISRLKAIKNACSSVVADCYLQVTGGAEGGHATHGPNIANVDISDSQSIRTYFARTNPQARTPRGASGVRGTPGYIPATSVSIPGGGTATYEVTGDNGRATGNHWHIQF